MNSAGEINKIYADIEAKMTRFKQEFADEFLKRVKEKTPVVTGALQAGFSTDMTPTGFTLSNTQDYAEYVENGTPKFAPRAMIATTVLESTVIGALAKQRAGIQ
jgi:hypothetical protein